MFRIEMLAYKKRGVKRKSQHKTQAQTLRGQLYQLCCLVKVMVANRHPVLSHTLVGFLVHIDGEGNGILFRTGRHQYSEKIRVEFVHMCGRKFPIVKRVPMVNN